MQRHEVRFEPLLSYIYVFSILILIGVYTIFADGDYSAVIIFCILNAACLTFHLLLRQEVIAILSEEGIEIIYEKFLKWEDIVSWEYWPGGKLFHWNELEIRTENDSFKIKGFKKLVVLQYFKYYIPEKRKGVVSHTVMYIVVVVIIAAYAIYKKQIK